MTMPGEQPKQGAGSGGPDRLSEIEARIDGLTKLTQQYEMARTAGRRTRTGISIVILLIALGFAAVLISTGYSFWNSKKERQEFLAQLQARMLSTESGTSYEALNMVRQVWPVYAEEARKQFSQEWPGIREKLHSEGEHLLADLKEQGQARIKARLEKIAKEAEQRLKVEFKGLDNEQTLATVRDNVEIALESAVMDVLSARTEKAKERLMAVKEKAVHFVAAESGETLVERVGKAWDQFLLYDVGVGKEAQP
jgi:tetrahydromethanopterin S-methyltransferase subunit G